MSYRKARTKHDRIKLITYISTYSNAREKRKKTTTKKLMCVNYTTLLQKESLVPTKQKPGHASDLISIDPLKNIKVSGQC